MQPENTNPTQNPMPPQQPVQPRSDFVRPSQTYANRPVQPYPNRPQAAPQQQQAQPTYNTPQPQAVPNTTPQQTNTNNYQPAPQKFTPQPAQQQPQAQQYASPTFRSPNLQQNQASTFTQPSPVSQPMNGMSHQQTPAQGQQIAQPGFARKTFDLNIDDSKAKSANRAFKLSVFAIFAIGIIGTVFGYMDKTQNNMVYTTILGLNTLVAIGLLLRKQLVYKAALGLALITITASLALALGYRGLASNTVKAEAMFIEEAKKLQNQSPTKQLTHEQQQHLDAIQLQVDAQKESVGKNSTIVYAKYGSTVVLYAAIAFYLNRSKVNEAFAVVKS